MSTCKVNLLTVLVCPITFPTPSTLLRVLNATQEMTESARGGTEVFTEAAEHFTAEQISDGDGTASVWISYGCDVLAVVIVVLAMGCKLYQVCAPQSRSNAGRYRSSEPDLTPLQSFNMPWRSALPSDGSYRPIAPDTTPLRDNAMPRPPASPPELESPPPYEAPPRYDSSWLI